MSKRIMICAGALVAIAVLLVLHFSLASSLPVGMTGKGDEDKKMSGKELFASRGEREVFAGWGGRIAPRTAFYPQTVEIKVGESVKWTTPTRVAEPHTITFIRDDNYAIPGIDVASYAVPSSVQFTPLPAGSNSEAAVVPGEGDTKIVMALNARSWSPVVIDTASNVKYLDANANYVMDGSEKYVNSGWLFGGNEAPPGSGGNTFTIIFAKAGEYPYSCIVHPWMIGVVIVK